MDYHLKPIGKTCAATGKELVPGSRCYSTLVEQDGREVRLDFSEEGWNGPPEGCRGFWVRVVPAPDQNKPKPLDADALMRYFEQLTEDASPANEKFRYIVALLLLQKRRLKIEGSRHDEEVEYLQVIGSQGEGPYEVRDQQLEDGEIEQLQQSLNTHLAAEWN